MPLAEILVPGRALPHHVHAGKEIEIAPRRYLVQIICR